LIRHAASKRTLPDAMIQTAFSALLMTPIGRSMLPASRYHAHSALQYRCPRSQHLQTRKVDRHSELPQNFCRRITSP
jgi:hypothetical protein